MTDKLKQILEEEIKKLPQEVQYAIDSFDWSTVSQEIGKEYLLDNSEINDFQTETAIALLGLTTPEIYRKNIEDNVGTSKEEAEQIATEAEEKIFNPIANIIEQSIKKNLQNQNQDAEHNLKFIISGGNYAVFLEEKPKEELDIPNIPPVDSVSNKQNLDNKIVI
jgi:hypothetical protein